MKETAFDGLDRASLRDHIVGTVSSGGWGKADLSLVSVGDRRAVLKDFHGKSLPVRLAGWLQISRELRAYGRLAGIPGVPAVYGRIDRLGFLMEEIRGRLLPRFRHRAIEQRRVLLGQLRAILDAAHAAGVIHNDARGHDNALVSEDGRVFLVDFAGAICLRPGGLAHRLLFPLLVRADEAAFLKWKATMLPEELTGDERSRLRRYAFWRRLWIFNPKGWGRSRGVLEAGARQEHGSGDDTVRGGNEAERAGEGGVPGSNGGAEGGAA